MNNYTLAFSGALLKEAYSLYVVKLTHPVEGVFYYIGQTGNRAVSVARAVFRRLSGHFDDQGYSTQNQIYRSIAIRLFDDSLKYKGAAFTKEVRQAVSVFFEQCEIKVQAFPVFEFDFGMSKKEHKIRRLRAEAMEQALIFEISSEKLLNIKRPHKAPILPTEDTAIVKEILACLVQ